MTAFLQGFLPVTRVLGSFGGTRLGVTPLQHFKKMNKNPLVKLVREKNYPSVTLTRSW